METKRTMKRYFFICYSYWSKDREGKGNMSISSDNFPSRKEINELAKENVSSKYGLLKSDVGVVLENFIEMEERDYFNFISKD